MRKQSSLALPLAIAALALSLYSVYQVSTTAGKGGDDLKTKVYEIIEAYVAEKSGQPAPSNEPIDVSLDDDAVKGSPNAPVTIVEFSDYECPFCGRYFNETFSQINKDYIETGKVKYVFRDFPLGFHPNAAPAANAAECVREQGDDEMYWAYHDILFANQTALTVDKLKEYAAELSIDQTQLADCIDTGKYNEEVQADFLEGQSYGVQGTPGFFINGKPLSGAQPYAVFKAAIEAALNE